MGLYVLLTGLWGWSEKTPLHEYMYMEVARSCVHLHWRAQCHKIYQTSNSAEPPPNRVNWEATGCSTKWPLRNERRNSILMTCHLCTQIWVEFLIGCAMPQICFNLSEALQDGLSAARFLRRYFAGKPGIAKCDRQILLFSVFGLISSVA